MPARLRKHCSRAGLDLGPLTLGPYLLIDLPHGRERDQHCCRRSCRFLRPGRRVRSLPAVVVVAERLGDIPQMVLKVYGHCMPDSEDLTRRAIYSAWSDGQGTDGGDHRQTSGLVTS